ncbi:MAG: GDSL-type esterase/lipase family protein, partial [Vicinamibacterales bacterium]
MSTLHRQSIVLLALIGLGACSSPTTPPPPPPDAPTLTCPASASLLSLDGTAVPYSFTVPTAVNGQAPVTVSCSRLGGSTFSPGSTLVTCTATDALSRQASCNFNVTVTIPPKISRTKFLAFGDSITFGRCGVKDNVCPPYTVRLEELLRQRYTQQNFVITTRGVSGETAELGEDRLPGELSRYNPEVLLLMEGTNDLTNGASNVPEALESLEDMIDLARNRGVLNVFIATIPPILPGGPNNSTIPLVVPFNSQIRNLAARKNVTLVDVYSALNADLNRYYLIDDLHPVAAGLRVIGETFYESIRATLDITP